MTAASGFLRGALIVGAMTGLSRLTGALADRLTVATDGPSPSSAARR